MGTVCLCVRVFVFFWFSSYVIPIPAVYHFLIRDFLTLNLSEEIKLLLIVIFD